MSTIFQLLERLQETAPLLDTELEKWIQFSDVSNSAKFFSGNKDEIFEAVKTASSIIVEIYLNSNNKKIVSLRRKSKYCILLNNFAVNSKLRPIVFEALDSLNSIFENSITEEGEMPFDEELGRLSEHVLVLLMRVTNYKLKASAVHEFAEHKTQFAIQLLIAVLLKEPAYEFKLRCNCINCLLGLTQPQAYFDANQIVEQHSCDLFTQKINFMLGLMLRLNAIQVVSDVLTEALSDDKTDMSIVISAFTDTMQTIMNIYKFASSDSTQWRQHILLSTTFLDGAVTAFIQTLLTALQCALERSNKRIPGVLLYGLNLSFKFGAFASYHLGKSGNDMRCYCTCFHDAFLLSLKPIVSNAHLSGQFMVLFVNLLHFMCNVDAFCDDTVMIEDDLIPELTTEQLLRTVERFLRNEVGRCGLPFTQAWHAHFRRGEHDIMLARDTTTYEIIDSFFNSIRAELGDSSVKVKEEHTLTSKKQLEQQQQQQQQEQIEVEEEKKKLHAANEAAKAQAAEEEQRLQREREAAESRALVEKQAAEAKALAAKKEAEAKALAERQAEEARIVAEKKAKEIRAAEERKVAEEKAAEAKALAERQVAEAKALAEKQAEEARVAAEKQAAEAKAFAEKQAAEAKAAEEKKVAEAKAAEERRVAEAKAAEAKALAEREAAEAKALAEKKAAEAKAAEEKKLAELKAAQAKALAEKKAAEAKRIEEEKAAAEAKALEEKQAAEAKALAEKQAAEAKKVAEKKAAQLKAEAEKKAAEAKAAEEKKKAELRAAELQAAAEKREAEAKALAARKEAEEKAIAAQKEAEARALAEKKEAEAKALAEKLAAEAKAEAERQAAEKARIFAEKQAAEAKALAEKQKEEAKQAAERKAAAAKALAEKQAAEAKALAEKQAMEAKVAAEKQAAEAKAAEERRAAEEAKAAAERKEAEAKALAEKQRIEAKALAERQAVEEKKAAEAKAAAAKAAAERREAEAKAAASREDAFRNPSALPNITPGKVIPEDVRPKPTFAAHTNDASAATSHSSKPPVSKKKHANSKNVKIYKDDDDSYLSETQREKARNPITGASGELRLLGNIPSLKKPKVEMKMSIDDAAKLIEVHQRRVVTADSADMSGVDPFILCALTGNVMKNPVSSPYGHTFEREAIISWLKENGSICPITGKPLTVEQLQPNQAIAARIMQQLLSQNLQTASVNESTTLYNF